MIDILPIITKTKTNQPLNKVNFETIVAGVIKNQIDHKQLVAWLMILCFRPLNDKEFLMFFDAVYKYSQKIDLSKITNFKIDKHSTGGIGDKTTIALCGILPSIGINMYKLSGKRLGYTGGTIDKLNSIENLQTQLSLFNENIINQTPIAISSPSDDNALSPFEALTYKLRNQTGSLESPVLVTISILIKKLILNNNALLLDVKIGSGAVFKNLDEASEFIRLSKLVCKRYNRPLKIVCSDMNQPLGKYIGNKWEVCEVLDLLANKNSNQRLRDLVFHLSAEALMLKTQCSFKTALQKVQNVIQSGSALKHFYQFVAIQNGETTDLQPPKLKHSIIIKAHRTGYFHFVNLETLGHLFNQISVDEKGVLDYNAGILVMVQNNQQVKIGQTLFCLMTNFSQLSESQLQKTALTTFTIDQQLKLFLPIVYKKI